MFRGLCGTGRACSTEFSEETLCLVCLSLLFSSPLGNNVGNEGGKSLDTEHAVVRGGTAGGVDEVAKDSESREGGGDGDGDEGDGDEGDEDDEDEEDESYRLSG